MKYKRTFSYSSRDNRLSHEIIITKAAVVEMEAFDHNFLRCIFNQKVMYSSF